MAFNDQPWAWVSRAEERQQNRQKFSTIVNAVRPYIAAGDIEGARGVLANANRPLVPTQPQGLSTANPAFKAAWDERMKRPAPADTRPEDDDDGGFRAAVKRGVKDSLSAGAKAGKKAGSTTLDVLGAGQKYVGAPAFNIATGVTEAKRVPILDAEGNPTGQFYRERPTWGDMGRGLIDAATSDPRDTYREGLKATPELMANPDMPAWKKTAYSGLTDPASYVGPGLARRGLTTVAPRLAETMAGRAAIGLLEAEGKVSAGGIAGAAGGSEIAARADIPGLPEPVEQTVLPIAGGLAGGVAAGALAPKAPAVRQGIEDRARQALEAHGGATAMLNSEAGSVALPGLGGMAQTPRGRAIGNILRKFEPTGFLARVYGEIPGLRENGAGTMPTWITEAPDLYDSAGLLNFKNVLETTEGLPVSAQASNAVWNTLGKMSGGPKSRFTLRVDDPRVYYIKKLYETNDQAIRDIADYMTETMATPALADLPMDNLGYAQVNGTHVNLINPNGVPLPRKATWNDILLRPEDYPDAIATLRPGQLDEIRALSLELSKMNSASAAMGVKIEGSVQPSAEGVYLPRGRPRERLREDVATSYRGPKIEGRRAGSSKERTFKSQGEGIEKGKAYPDPVEAVREHITERLREQNAMHAWNLLKDVPVNGGKLGDAQVPRAVTDELGDIRPNIKALSREKRKLASRKAVADRDVRMLGGGITRASERLQGLYQRATDLQVAGEERVAAAREMVTSARTALDDSLSAARELARKLEGGAANVEQARQGLAGARSTQTQANRALREIVDEAQRRADELDTLEQMLGSAREVSAGSVKNVTADHLAFAKEATEKLYVETARAEAGLRSFEEGPRPQRAREASYAAREGVEEAKAGVTSARDELRNLRQMFGANVDESRRRAIDLSIAEGVEAKATVDTRLALTRGQIREIARDMEERGRRVRAAINKSDELGAEMDDLVQKLEPLKERRTELLAQVKEVRKTARERAGLFDGEIGLEPGLGVPVPAEIANAFNKALRPTGEPGRFTAVFDLVNNGMRSLGATLDASRQMTVGLLGMADNPKVAGSAVKGGVQAVKDPASMWRNLAAIQDAHPDMPPLHEAVGRDGLQIAASENSLAAGARQNGGAMSKLANLPGVKQADALYSAPSNIERAERYYKLLEEWKAVGQDWTSPQARARAAAVANLASGRARGGVLSPFVGTEASGRIAFAGRFVQSQFETVFNAAFVGGVEGYEARKALLRLVAGGMAVSAGYNAFAEKTGQDYVPWDEFFEPGGPNMGRMRIAGRDVSIFGPWDSLAKGVIRAAQGDPEYFLRSKLAPVPATLYSAISGPMGIGGEGKNAVGENLSVKDIVPVPFGLRDIGEAAIDTDPTDPAALGSLLMLTGTALLGVKSSPESPTERLSTIALRLYGEDAGAWRNGDATGKFYDLMPGAQAEIKRDHPELWAEAVERGSEERKQAETVKAEGLSQQQADDELMLSGKLDRDRWNANTKTRSAELAGATGIIYRDDKANGRKGDALLDEYFKRIEDSKVNGVPDFDQVYAWVDSLDPAQQQRITDNTGLNQTPLRKLYRDIADEYYSIPKYSGMSAAEANSASYLRAVARDRLSGRREPADAQVIAMARRLAPQLGMSAKDVANVARLERGQARALRGREQWAEAHPESSLILGNGPLAPYEVAAINAALARKK